VGIGAVFAQTQPAATPAAAEQAPKEKKSSLTVDLFPLVKGIIASDDESKVTYFSIFAGFEQLVAPHFTIGADLDLIFGKWDTISGIYLGVSAEGRYYPMSENFEKLFLGATLGFNSLSIDGKSKPQDGGFTGLVTSLKLGYKIISAKDFIIEPSMSYVLSKYSMLSAFGISIPTPLGWQGGLRIGFTL
jgi:hypothetical protein